VPMRVIAKKRCRAMVEPPEKGERVTLNPNLSTRLKHTFFRSGPWAKMSAIRIHHRLPSAPSPLKHDCLLAQLALQWVMPALTRRRDHERREECWLIYFGDVHVGTIAVRSVAANLISEGIPH
jgi:hypothetical protein